MNEAKQALPDGRATVTEILRRIQVVDAHLDAAAPEIYRGDHPASKLANRWRRIGAGPASEGIESLDALNLATGGNPRKGIVGDDGTICGELGDTAVSALLAIQSITKDTETTWAWFLWALNKAYGRVPDTERQPSPVTQIRALRPYDPVRDLAELVAAAKQLGNGTGSSVQVIDLAARVTENLGLPGLTPAAEAELAIRMTLYAEPESLHETFPPESGMDDQAAEDNGITG